VKQEMIIIQIKRHFSLKVVSLACLTLCYPAAFAIGFGEAALHSNLGDVLRVQVPLTGATEDILVPSCFKPKIETLNGELIDVPRMEFVVPTPSSHTAYINVISNKVMVEPAVKFTIAMTCGSFAQRGYPILLDFADSTSAAPLPAPVPVAVPDTQISAIQVVKPVPAAAAMTQKKSRVTRSESESDGARTETANTVAVKSASKHAKHAETAGKDVLKVSSEDSVSDFELKMSQSLTTAPSQNADQQRIEENKIAQAQFAAILRGEDPLLAAQNQIKQQELKAKKLQAELDRIKQQDALAEQKDKGFSPLLMGLAATIAALVLALIGLVVIATIKSRKNKEKTWWDAATEQKKNVVDIVDYLQTTAEKGNLDPNPITTAREVASKENTNNTAAPDSSINKEEPSPKFKRMGLPALEDTNSSTFNFFGNRGQSIHIEEISDITQEAEFWMSVNDPHRAIEILEPQSRDENQTTPVTWLYLLDLYRLVGDEDNYRDLRARFKLKFNAKIPNFNEEILAGSARSFEDFPHLVANCCALWHSEDIFGFLESLLVDDREGERVGFDLPVYRDILFLLSICNELERVKYKALPKEDLPVKTDETTNIVVETKLAVKPDEPESSEYSNSLNFDLLDFKSGDKEKG
jgi:hypothetical protein